jgi:Spy/CpxP family protein refolding chaperone
MTSATSASGRSRGPWLAALVLLLAVLAGGLGGVVLDRLVLLPGMGLGHGWEHGPGRRPPRDREFRTRFARELGLSRAQQQRIDSIMERQGRELRAIRGQVQPQLDSIISRTRVALDSVLTPEQRQEAAEIRRRHPRPPRPGRGDFPAPDTTERPPPGPPPR